MQHTEGSSSSSNDREVAHSEHRALALAAVAALATILWLMSPVGTGMLLGLLLAFVFRPTYARIARRWSPATAGLTTVLGSTLALALMFGGLVWIVVRDGTMLGREVVESLGPGGGAKRIVAVVGEQTSRIGVSTEELDAKARSLVLTGVSRAESIAQAVASATGAAVLALFFQMLTMYFVLRHWRPIVATVQETVPLRPDYTLELLEEFRRVGRTTLLSMVVMGLLQGAVATVGYVIAGIPQPLFFGVLTGVASLVPGVGTMLVWTPAAVILTLLGHAGSGIFLAVWGVVVLTSIPSYVIHPRLVGRGSDVPSLFTFIALFGGAAVFGLKGLIIGPVLMTMAIAVLRLYAGEERARRHVVADVSGAVADPSPR